MFNISSFIRFKEEEPLFAVDISADSIKALKLTCNPSTHKWTVQHWGRIALPEETFDGMVVKNEPQLTQEILGLFSAFPHCNKVAMALPDAAVISKVIQVSEGLEEYEIEELITIEFGNYIPFPVEEVNFDFQVLGTPTKNPDLVDVLLVATRKEYVESRLRAFEMAKIKVEIVDVESNLIQRVLKHHFGENVTSNTMVIDMGAYSIKQYAFEGSELAYVHEEQFGGRQLTNMAANQYNMSQPDFLELIPDKLPRDCNDVILQPYLATASTQIKRLIDYFFSASRFSEINNLYLIGGAASLPGLADMVTEKVNIEAQLLNPFLKMEFNEADRKDVFLKQASAWTGVSGLAMRRHTMSGWLTL